MSPPNYKLPKNPSPYFVCFLAASCMSFIAMFDNAEAYGKASDAVVADPEFQALLVAISSTGEWVRHNLARGVF